MIDRYPTRLAYALATAWLLLLAAHVIGRWVG
jgi:hypothetical protein